MTHHFRTLREAGLTRTTVTGRTHTIELRRAELGVTLPRPDRRTDQWRGLTYLRLAELHFSSTTAMMRA
jgi:hypothetical protein